MSDFDHESCFDHYDTYCSMCARAELAAEREAGVQEGWRQANLTHPVIDEIILEEKFADGFRAGTEAMRGLLREAVAWIESVRVIYSKQDRQWQSAEAILTRAHAALGEEDK